MPNSIVSVSFDAYARSLLGSALPMIAFAQLISCDTVMRGTVCLIFAACSVRPAG
jgi:hypothetical protein